MQSKPCVSARWFRSLVPNLLFGLLVGALTSARAASPSIWNGGGANDYWNNATNWGGNIPVPDTAYDLQFGGMTRLTPVNDFPAAGNFRHITFNADAGAFTLGGNSITLNGHITNNSTSLQTINLPISTGAGRYVATTAGNITFGGAISGNGGLHLAGPGAVTLSGQNSFTNYLYVNGGILNLPTGASISNRWYVFAGQTAAHSGAINITGGTLTNTLASGSTGSLMIGRAGYGALSMSSGTVRVNYVNIGWTGGMGLVSISGGNFYCGGTGGDYVVIGTSTAPSTGVLTVSGTGFFSHANVNRTISVNNNADARGEINVLGGTLNNSGGAVSFGYNSALNALGSGAGIVNLNAGTLTLNRFVNKSANAGPTGSSYVNFNGGTLTASASTLTSPNLAFSSNFIPAAIEVRVNGAFGSYTGGAVIDTAGQDCLVEPALLAPTGSGIASVPVTDGGAGYIGAPYVSITGDGTGATAIANMVDDGTGKGTFKVGSITVCNPGVDYVSPSVALTGGVPTTAATLGTPTTALNSAGGLTKNGAGTLTLLGANTYPGATVVNGGRLIVSSAHTGGGSFTAKDGAVLGVARDAVTTALATPSLTLGTTSGAGVELVLPEGNPAAQIITAGLLTLNGTNNVTVSGSNFVPGQFPLIKYTTLNGDPGSLTNGFLIPPDGTLAKLVHNPGNSSFDLLITVVSGALKWVGTVNSGGVGAWDNLITTNWINNGVQKAFVPGADTTLDDTAAGVTTIGLVGLIEPGSVTVDNSSKNYTLGGTGTLGGTTSLTKSGTGTLTMTNASTYSGATIVSGGILVLGGSLSNSAGAVTVDGGTLTATGAIKTGTGPWSAGGTASAKGVININAGAAIELNGNFILGSVADGSGAVNISGGSLTNTQASLASNFEIGTAGYGALNMSGGLVKVNTFYVGGGSGVGTALISGGTFFAGGVGAADYLLVGGVSAGTGVLTVSGGLLNHATVNRLISVNNNSDGRGELNLLGGAIDNSGGGVGYGYNTGSGLGTGIVNLNGGNLTLNRFVNTKQGGTTATGNAWLNFNGATVTASPSSLTSPNPSFSSSFIPARMEVRINGAFGTFAGGVVIDTAGQDCLVESALLAPTGDGIRTLAVADGGSGYIGAPYVSIMGDGTGATAVANMVPDGSGGLKVGSITVCNPGVNYTAGATSFTFVGGAPTIPATPGAVATAANASGGLTKNGAGALTLLGANTYTGATVVNGGTLRVDGLLDAGSAVIVAGGVLGGNGVIGGPVSVQSGGTLAPGTSIGILSINNTLTLAAGSTTFVEVNASTNGSDLVQGITTANYGGTLIVTNTEGTLTSGQTFQIFSAADHNSTFASVQSADGGATWAFNPTNGVLTVVSATATTPTNLTYAVSGSTLALSWPASHLGWYAQSNSVNVAEAGSWHDIAGSQLGTSLNLTIEPGMSNVFYRLRKP